MIVCEIAKAFNARGICDGSRWPVAGGRWPVARHDRAEHPG
jgi:hypothetical protein